MNNVNLHDPRQKSVYSAYSGLTTTRSHLKATPKPRAICRRRWWYARLEHRLFQAIYPSETFQGMK